PEVRTRADASQRSTSVRDLPARPYRHPPRGWPLRPHPHWRPDLRHDPLRKQRAPMVRATAIAPQPIARRGTESCPNFPLGADHGQFGSEAGVMFECSGAVVTGVAEENATTILAQMTAGFAFGQLVGPVASAAFERFTANASVGLSYAMRLAAAGLMISAIYLGQETRQRNQFKEHCHG